MVPFAKVVHVPTPFLKGIKTLGRLRACSAGRGWILVVVVANDVVEAMAESKSFDRVLGVLDDSVHAMSRSSTRLGGVAIVTGRVGRSPEVQCRLQNYSAKTEDSKGFSPPLPCHFPWPTNQVNYFSCGMR